MKNVKFTLSSVFIIIILTAYSLNAQTDSLTVINDSVNSSLLVDYKKRIAEIEQQRIIESIKKAELELQLKTIKTTDKIQKQNLIEQLNNIEKQEQQRVEQKKKRIEQLKQTAKGYPVIGAINDTLFYIYSKIGASTPKNRADNVTQRIDKLYSDSFLKIDSISFAEAENTVDIFYGETIIMSISETDALWHNTTKLLLAQNYSNIIKNSLKTAKAESRILKVLIRIGLLILVLAAIYAMLWLIGKGFSKTITFFESKKDKWLKNLSYKDYTFLTAEQEYKAILFLLKPVKWFSYAIVLYIALPLIFSIFPFTRSWADDLFSLIWTPFKGVFVAVWQYLPNLFTILVIVFVMKYVIRFVKYIFNEIESEKLKISGFHADWAMPTYSIIKFLLYAFMFVLIFPYLPGSDSDIFKGVSVFIGILFSLGSSTAIANMVAGLVITYMRPFKIGDRIKIGDVFGDVEEKTLLVTRIKTPKNEIITIPNSAVLSGNTINYTSETYNNGLILHTTVTLGYDVPWKLVHSSLIDAALRTEFVLHEPKPFVLQTSLDDFYVSYQINAYTKNVKNLATIYSNLHQNIQDICNENGIEILSPHYRAQRDGNTTTIPANYLKTDYKAPSFSVKIENNK